LQLLSYDSCWDAYPINACAWFSQVQCCKPLCTIERHRTSTALHTPRPLDAYCGVEMQHKAMSIESPSVIVTYVLQPSCTQRHIHRLIHCVWVTIESRCASGVCLPLKQLNWVSCSRAVVVYAVFVASTSFQHIVYMQYCIQLVDNHVFSAA